MGGVFFTDFKSLNGIEISWLVQVLLNFNWFWGFPLEGGRWINGVGVGMGVWWVSHACMHMHAHMHAHTCTCMLNINMLNMINMDASMSAAISNFYTCIHVHACMCMHLHACVCMWEHPPCLQMPPDTPRHLPPPQSCREPKTKFNKSWTHIDYSCSPWIPPHPPAPLPRAKETQIGRITITFEWNEIIQFCLKIWNPWTLLHTYRLDLMCRWGCPITNGTFYVFYPKKCSCDPAITNFLFLYWIPLDHI